MKELKGKVDEKSKCYDGDTCQSVWDTKKGHPSHLRRKQGTLRQDLPGKAALTWAESPGRAGVRLGDEEEGKGYAGKWYADQAKGHCENWDKLK